MELRLQLSEKNRFPLRAILIKGSSIAVWLGEIQRMKLSLENITTWPVPGTKANSIWGCLVALKNDSTINDIGKNIWCQSLADLLFIPERTILYPLVTLEETEKILGHKKHLLHPVLGLFELDVEVDWKEILTVPVPLEKKMKEPAASVFIPKQIKTFQIKPATPEEVIKEMEENLFPSQKTWDQPLSPIEKIKLFFYKQVFSRVATAEGNVHTEKKSVFSFFQKLNDALCGGKNKLADKMQEDFEALERRSQKQVDRLMDLFKKDPEEALKYAIPLDGESTGRSNSYGSFSMEKRWFDFSLFGGSSAYGSRTAVMPDDSFASLQLQYQNIARELIDRKDFKKAAFVYMKLLKNYILAAQTLQDGGFYQEAASVYLKYCKDKRRAAECFEKGRMFSSAIELYKELSEDEKVGDLYRLTGNEKEALFYYQKLADHYNLHDQCVKSALIYKNKMQHLPAAQDVLLRGWRSNKDAFNCLNNYFSNIVEEKQVLFQLQQISAADLNNHNKGIFLRVLEYEYCRRSEIEVEIKDMAYEIISEHAAMNPSIISELRMFNKEDKQLVKDTMRFKMNYRKKN